MRALGLESPQLSGNIKSDLILLSAAGPASLFSGVPYLQVQKQQIQRTQKGSVPVTPGGGVGLSLTLSDEDTSSSDGDGDEGDHTNKESLSMATEESVGCSSAQSLQETPAKKKRLSSALFGSVGKVFGAHSKPSPTTTPLSTIAATDSRALHIVVQKGDESKDDEDEQLSRAPFASSPFTRRIQPFLLQAASRVRLSRRHSPRCREDQNGATPLREDLSSSSTTPVSSQFANIYSVRVSQLKVYGLSSSLVVGTINPYVYMTLVRQKDEYHGDVPSIQRENGSHLLFNIDTVTSVSVLQRLKTKVVWDCSGGKAVWSGMNFDFTSLSARIPGTALGSIKLVINVFDKDRIRRKRRLGAVAVSVAAFTVPYCLLFSLNLFDYVCSVYPILPDCRSI